MMRGLLLLLFSIFSCELMASNTTLDQLLVAKQNNLERLIQIDASISSLSILLTNNLDQISNIEDHKKSLDGLYNTKQEFKVRQAFYDKLIFYAESNPGKNERVFFQSALTKIINGNNPTSESLPPYWKFSTILLNAINTVIEPKESVVGFMKELLLASSILNPASPTIFLSKRDYTNGVENKKAADISAEKAGDIAEKNIEESNKIQASRINTLRFELRKPIPKNPQSIIEQKTILKNPAEQWVTEKSAPKQSVTKQPITKQTSATSKGNSQSASTPSISETGKITTDLSPASNPTNSASGRANIDTDSDFKVKIIKKKKR